MRKLEIVLAILAILACGLLIAATASAARMIPNGVWIPGDNVRLLRLGVTNERGVGWGTAVGTCYTPTIEITGADSSTVLVEMTGTWEDSTEKAVLLPLGSLTVLAPSSGYRDLDFILYMTKAGSVAKIAADERAEPFRFRLWARP